MHFSLQRYEKLYGKSVNKTYEKPIGFAHAWPGSKVLPLTPLICAARRGHVEVAKLLIQHGANVDKEVECAATPLIAAVEGCHAGPCGHFVPCCLTMVKLLLGLGADVNKAEEDCLKTPLHRAVDVAHTAAYWRSGLLVHFV